MQDTLERPLVTENPVVHYGDVLAPLKILRASRLVSLFRRRDARRNALKRIEDEEVSWIVEALNASFETEYSFGYDGKDILTSDGHSVRQLLENGLKNAADICAMDGYYGLGIMDRAQAEYENHLLQLEMAAGRA